MSSHGEANIEVNDTTPTVSAPTDSAPTDAAAEHTVAVAATTTTEDPSRGWRRLSVRMLLVHPLQEVRRFLVPLIVVVFFGRSSGGEDYYGLIGLAVVVVLGVTRWFTTTYRV